MKTYKVSEVSEMLDIPKDTLIYYDRLDIVRPERGSNGYRYYTKKEIDECKFVEVAKHNGFSLKEIQRYLQYQRQPTVEGFQWQREDMKRKKADLNKKKNDLQAMIDLLDVVDDLMEQKVKLGSSNSDFFKDFLDRTFDALKGYKNEE